MGADWVARDMAGDLKIKLEDLNNRVIKLEKDKKRIKLSNPIKPLLTLNTKSGEGEE